MKSQVEPGMGFIPIDYQNENALEGVVSVVSRSAGVVILALALLAIVSQLVG